jgi:hypothetical protein
MEAVFNAVFRDIGTLEDVVLRVMKDLGKL